MRKKIFVCVGTHTQQFDRLLKKTDELAQKHKNEFEFFGQTGSSNYQPKNFPFVRFLDELGFEERVSSSDIIIGHAGAGLIISALDKKKRIIIVPRLEKFSEHTDSHQVDIATALSQKNKAIAVFDEKFLYASIMEAENFFPVIENRSSEMVGAIIKALEKKQRKL